jgi:hypothetical protein
MTKKLVKMLRFTSFCPTLACTIPSFAPPIQRTVDLSNVAGALSFNAFAFFATNVGAQMTALGIGAGGIAFATAAGAVTTAVGAATFAASMARTAWCFGQGVAHIVQYLTPLLEEAHAPHSQLEAEEEEAMIGGLCMLVVCVLRTPVVLLGSHLYVRQKNGKPQHIGDCRKGLFKTN